MKSLDIAPHLHANLRWCISLWDHWLSRDLYAMGGGSVLAARWHHRYSTDIDLFMDLNCYRELPLAKKMEMNQILREMVELGEIQGLEIHNDGYLFESPYGNASFFGTLRLTENPLSDETESLTGIATESSVEILFRKLRGRMINGVSYLPRDLYDFVCAYGLDRKSFDAAFEMLEPQELESLKFDVQSGATQVYSLDRIIEPRFSRLVQSLESFNAVTSAVLLRDFSGRDAMELREIFAQH